MWSLFSHYNPKAFYGARALSKSSCHPNWTQRELVKTAAAGKVSTVLLQPELVPPVQPHRSAAGPTVPVLVQLVLGSGVLFLYLASFLLLSPLLMGAEVPSPSYIPTSSVLVWTRGRPRTLCPHQVHVSCVCDFCPMFELLPRVCKGSSTSHVRASP